MLIVKLMSNIHVRDDDPRAEHVILTGVVHVDFRETLAIIDEFNPDVHHVAQLTMGDGEEITRPLLGNAYVMNESGRTISQFHPRR